MPLSKLCLIVVGVAVDEDEVWGSDGDAREKAADVGWWEHLCRVQEEIVAGHFHARDGRLARDVVYLHMQASEQRFDGNLQDVDLVNVKMDASIRSGPDGAEQFHRQRKKQLVDRAGKLDLIALAADVDVLEREAGGIEEVAYVAEIGVYDAFPNNQDEGIGIVEGGGDVSSCAHHLAAEPTDVDTKLRAFAQEDIVRVDVRGRDHGSGWQCAAGRGCCR